MSMPIFALRTTVLLTALLIAVSATAANPRPGRYAVLVGIDDYSAFGLTRPADAVTPDANRPLPRLGGAVADVAILREMLVNLYRFDRRNIITLTNQQATRAAIVRAIEDELIARARKDDVVFFYYAGHGSKVPNPASDETDKMDESIVPADSRLGARDIRDKDLRRLFNRVLDRDARLTVVLDACFSGSGVRNTLLVAPTIRGVKAAERPIIDRASVGPRPEDRGALIVSASQDDGTAAEITLRIGETHGAFSWAWIAALSAADPGEPAADSFLRARARLQLDFPRQEPVLAGTDAARLAPFFGDRADRRNGRTVVAVERVRKDGTIVLQGGWANGIGVGSRLDVKGQRLEVTAVDGVARCRARLVGKSAGRLESGSLAEVIGWVAPRGVPMHVWIPRAGSSTSALLAIAGRIARQAARRNLQWITDPTDVAPDYILRGRGRTWELVPAHGARITAADPIVLTKKVPRGRSFYVQLPAVDSLVSPTDENVGVAFVNAPELADYILCGRYASGRLEYAWIRATGTKGDSKRSGLPQRTDWKPAVTATLRDAMLRLRRIHAWLTLQSPPGMRPPYMLAVRGAIGDVVTDGVLIGGYRYGLLLRRRAGVTNPVNPRYVYVFSIDSYGRSVLVYPVNTGSVENRISGSLTDIPLGPSELFRAVEPYGVDTYFLLTTEEALPNPSIFDFDGVKSLDVRGETPLERLLVDLEDPTRGARVNPTPPEWSIERLAFESMPRSVQ